MNFEDINYNNYELSTPYPKITVNLDTLRSEDDDNGMRTISMLINAYSGNKGEITASMQYVYQSFLVKKEFNALYELLEKISIKEMQHMEILSQILVNLNITPKYCKYIDNNINLCNNWSANNINYSTDIRDFINYNISLESSAINEYTAIINNTRNENIKEILTRIIQDEKIHLEIFYAILNRLDN